MKFESSLGSLIENNQASLGRLKGLSSELSDHLKAASNTLFLIEKNLQDMAKHRKEFYKVNFYSDGACLDPNQ